MPLKLSNTLTLPDNAVTQTFAFIARKGGGKTYAAGKLTEELLTIGATVIVIDVVGTWYGLRLSANGKGAGFPIAIFGGEHGDVDLDPTQGEALGQLLVSRDLSAVVDISQFRKGARQRFATDFAEALFHHAKSNRAPRMVIMEEAQTLAPQRTKPGDERMLGAFEDIVRLGRNYGIGATLISQRPQSINKEVLNQVECLFVGQLNADHERKAIEAWVTDHKANKDWTQRLPQLERGHMIAWSPQWLKVMKEVTIGKKSTYDASSTPELGVHTPRAKNLAPIDAPSLRAALDAAQTRATARTAKPVAVLIGARAEAAELAALRTELEVLRRETVDRAALLRSTAELEEALAVATTALNEVRHLARINVTQQPSPHVSEPPPVRRPGKPARATQAAAALPRPGPPTAAAPPGLKAGILRMLACLAAFAPGTMTKAQVARAAAMKVTSGTFSTYWGTLRRDGLIEEPAPKLFRASERGLERLGNMRPEVPNDMAGRLAFWQTRLKAGERRLLEHVLEARNGLSRAELAEATQMSATSGTFSTYLGSLTRNRLVAKRNDGTLIVHPWLAGRE